MVMTKAEVLRLEAGREPGGAQGCGSFVRVWGGRWLLKRSVVLEQVPERRPPLEVQEPPVCARLGQLRARLDVATVGFLCPRSSSRNRLVSPPWHPPRATSRYRHPPAPWRAQAKGRRWAWGGKWGAGKREEAVARRPRGRWENRTLSACFRGFPSPLALWDF